MLALAGLDLKHQSASYRSSLIGLGCFLGVYALFDVVPVVLPKSDVVRGLRWGDIADAPLLFLLVTAYVLLGLQAGLWRSNALKFANGFAVVVLIQGHGIHMAANAISASLDASSPGWRPAYVMDEHWGHTELQSGMALEAVIFIAAADNGTEAGRLAPTSRILLALFAFAYGLFLTADAIEGQTVPLVIPAAVVLTLVAFSRRGRPLSLYRSFFVSAFATAVVVLTAYGLWHGGFPEHNWHVWQYFLEG